MKKYATVESVTDGHPDKICDQVSDAILDAYLEKDSNARVAVETFGSHGTLVVGGEVTSDAEVDVQKLAYKLYREIGYDDDLDVLVKIAAQSQNIAQGVDTGGAGDQGIMYGYATDETEEFLPLPVVLSHRLTKGLRDLRRENPSFSFLGPDGKSQITFHGDELTTVLVSVQHSPGIAQEELREKLERWIRDVLADYVRPDTAILINPTGTFEIGGFAADSGLTGRKIMVDTYGGLAPHGGGAFSGKDPTKVDRSAAYYTRWAAKNVVAQGLANECLISVAYAIGEAEPLMVHAETEKGYDPKVTKYITKHFDFRPKAMIEQLDLRKPIYRDTAAFGHFGRAHFPWERTVLF